MLFLFYKFLGETTTLLKYLFSYYLTNIVVITSLQILFISFFYFLFLNLKQKNNFQKFNSKLNLIEKNNSDLIKKILVTYHTEQISFIKKLFDNEAIQELFKEKNQTYVDAVFFPIIKSTENNSKTTKTFCENLKVCNKNNYKLPKLPESPQNNNDT